MKFLLPFTLHGSPNVVIENDILMKFLEAHFIEF